MHGTLTHFLILISIDAVATMPERKPKLTTINLRLVRRARRDRTLVPIWRVDARPGLLCDPRVSRRLSPRVRPSWPSAESNLDRDRSLQQGAPEEPSPEPSNAGPGRPRRVAPPGCLPEDRSGKGGEQGASDRASHSSPKLPAMTGHLNSKTQTARRCRPGGETTSRAKCCLEHAMTQASWQSRANGNATPLAHRHST